MVGPVVEWEIGSGKVIGLLLRARRRRRWWCRLRTWFEGLYLVCVVGVELGLDVVWCFGGDVGYRTP